MEFNSAFKGGGALRYAADMQSGMYSTGGPLRDL